MNIRKQFANLLRELADKFDAGNTELDEEQTIQLMGLIAHQPLNKEAAAKYLHMSTSKFDTLIRQGWLPKGRKKLGEKNKIWFKDELDKAVKRLDE